MSFEEDSGLGISGGREEESQRNLGFRLNEEDVEDNTIPDPNDNSQLLTIVNFVRLGKRFRLKLLGPSKTKILAQPLFKYMDFLTFIYFNTSPFRKMICAQLNKKFVCKNHFPLTNPTKILQV